MLVELAGNLTSEQYSLNKPGHERWPRERELRSLRGLTRVTRVMARGQSCRTWTSKDATGKQNCSNESREMGCRKMCWREGYKRE